MKHLGFQTMVKATEIFSAVSKNTVTPLLDKARGELPPPPAKKAAPAPVREVEPAASRDREPSESSQLLQIEQIDLSPVMLSRRWLSRQLTIDKVSEMLLSMLLLRHISKRERSFIK